MYSIARLLTVRMHPHQPPCGNAYAFIQNNRFYEPLPKTPFIVLFRLDEQADTLTVLTILHHAQDHSAFDPEDGG